MRRAPLQAGAAALARPPTQDARLHHADVVAALGELPEDQRAALHPIADVARTQLDRAT